MVATIDSPGEWFDGMQCVVRQISGEMESRQSVRDGNGTIWPQHIIVNIEGRDGVVKQFFSTSDYDIVIGNNGNRITRKH